MKKATYNWFPGHMNKALKAMEDKMPALDLMIEIIDARAPSATQNSTFHKLFKQKPLLLLLAKADLADPSITKKWLDYFQNRKQSVLVLDYQKPQFEKKLIQAINQATHNWQIKQKNRGFLQPQINAIVVGIPNVGKSTFINHLIKQKKVKVGNRPGVTKGLQLIQLNSTINLFDSPGILPSRLSSENMGNLLAALQAIKSGIYPPIEVAVEIWQLLFEHYGHFWKDFYQLSDFEFSGLDSSNAYAFFDQIAQKNLPSTKTASPSAFLESICENFLKKIADGVWPISLERPLDETI